MIIWSFTYLKFLITRPNMRWDWNKTLFSTIIMISFSISDQSGLLPLLLSRFFQLCYFLKNFLWIWFFLKFYQTAYALSKVLKKTAVQSPHEGEASTPKWTVNIRNLHMQNRDESSNRYVLTGISSNCFLTSWFATRVLTNRNCLVSNCGCNMPRILCISLATQIDTQGKRTELRDSNSR